MYPAVCEVVKRNPQPVNAPRNEFTGFEVITKETLVNCPSSMMGLSRFELRLLHFFDDFCVSLFSFNVNVRVDKMWRESVPQLFGISPLVRKAVFLFAAINMWPLCDVDTLFHSDVKVSMLLYNTVPVDNGSEVESTTKPFFDMSLKNSKTDNLFMRTLSYFSDVLSETQRALTCPRGFSGSSLRAAELVVSGILVYLFLGLHPHKLVPLLSFQLETSDYDSSCSTDFVAMCRGTQNLFELGKDNLTKTKFRVIFFTPEKIPYFVKAQKFAIVERLRNELSRFFADQDDYQAIEEKEAIDRAIELLSSAFYYSAKLKYPIPLFKWPLVLPQYFDVLLRQKHIFALRLYYQFACICTIANFSLYHDTNMWKDFIEWFRVYNMKEYGRWFYEFDRCFYDLVIGKNFRFGYDNFSFLYDFDPLKPEHSLLEFAATTK